MKKKRKEKINIHGTPGTHALSIEIICSPRKSRETIPLTLYRTFILYKKELNISTTLYKKYVSYQTILIILRD